MVYNSRNDENNGIMEINDEKSPFNKILNGYSQFYFIIIDTEGNMFGGYEEPKITTAYVNESSKKYIFSIKIHVELLKKMVNINMLNR